jgi:hypothetical protein
MNNPLWFTNSYRRGLLDMHIEQWSDEFMSQYNPQAYVALLTKAEFQSIMIYTNSHIGYCYWPTKSGVEHKGTAGKDVLGQFLNYANEAGLNTILYYSLIFNIWAYENHEDWRIRSVDGSYSRGSKLGRVGVCCPNSEGYRAFVTAQIKELCDNYKVDGIFFDMTFWPPIVCYCDSCQARYAREIGGSMPTVIDWNDEKWVKLQEKREEWLVEFAAFATNLARKCNGSISVSHNFSTATHNWQMAQTEGVNNACDYTSGDFYGGLAQQSFICKLFRNLTRTMPFEYMASRCYPDLGSHTNNMPKEMMYQRDVLALAHGGAFFYIDAIDPVGTINPAYYDEIGDIYRETQKYEKYLRGRAVADAAVYFSMASKFNPADNGKMPTINPAGAPHVYSALKLSNTLRENHIPFTVIGKRNLGDIEKYQAVFLPEVLKLGDDDKKLLTDYVYQGGNLYLSGGAILKYLGEEAGLSLVGETEERYTFTAPAAGYGSLFSGFDAKYPLAIPFAQPLVRPAESVEVLATITLPYTNPMDPFHFVSFHSNPPGIATANPSITRNKYGQGTILWSAAPLERIEWATQKENTARLVRTLLPKPLGFTAQAAAPVEILVYEKDGGRNIVVNLVNIQEATPVLPVYDIEVRVRLDGRRVMRAMSVGSGAPVECKTEGGYAVLSIDKLRVFEMIEIECV